VQKAVTRPPWCAAAPIFCVVFLALLFVAPHAAHASGGNGELSSGSSWQEEISTVITAVSHYGVHVDTARVAAATVDAVVKAIDPHGAVLSASDADRLRREISGIDTNGVQRPNIDSFEEWPEHIIFVELNGFFTSATDPVADAVRKAATQECTGVILDLRGAGGTALQGVRRTAGIFLSNTGVLFTVVNDAGEPQETYSLLKAGAKSRARVMVITDTDTAGACELLASLLKNTPVALVIGERTSGDAAVRKFIALDDGRTLHIRTHRVVPGRGPAYDPGGVAPDIVVGKSMRPAGKAPRETGKETEREKLAARVRDDAPLQRAVDVLLGLHALEKGRFDAE
jgi:hypothetical protein